MKTDFCSSETRKNLMRAFAGECQSRQRYYQAALIAQQEKYVGLERMFRFTAEQEERHAKVFFELLKDCAGESIRIEADYPADVYSTLPELLKASAAEEYHEAAEVYPEFEQIARKEGFLDAAGKFKMIASIEQEHHKRFDYYSKLMENGTLFRSESTDEAWICLNCGHIHTASEPPSDCPVCGAEKGYFIRLAEAPFTFGGMLAQN